MTLSNNIEIVTLNDVEIIILDGKVNYNYKGILYTKEEFEDTFLSQREKILATTSDVGKLVCFYDNPKGDKYFGILYEVISQEDSPYIRGGDFSAWKYARRLTPKEIKELC